MGAAEQYAAGSMVASMWGMGQGPFGCIVHSGSSSTVGRHFLSMKSATGVVSMRLSGTVAAFLEERESVCRNFITSLTRDMHFIFLYYLTFLKITATAATE